MGWEYERQKGKDLDRAAKEKAFQEKDLADKRVCFFLNCNLHMCTVICPQSMLSLLSYPACIVAEHFVLSMYQEMG